MFHGMKLYGLLVWSSMQAKHHKKGDCNWWLKT